VKPPDDAELFQKIYNVINLHQVIEEETKQEIYWNQDPETTGSN
jgi:hypothetical protein